MSRQTLVDPRGLEIPTHFEASAGLNFLRCGADVWRTGCGPAVETGLVEPGCCYCHFLSSAARVGVVVDFRWLGWQEERGQLPLSAFAVMFVVWGQPKAPPVVVGQSKMLRHFDLAPLSSEDQKRPPSRGIKEKRSRTCQRMGRSDISAGPKSRWVLTGGNVALSLVVFWLIAMTSLVRGTAKTVPH